MTILVQILVVLGAGFMLASILASFSLKEKVPAALRTRWRYISGLMIFFLAGYAAFAVILASRIAFPLELLTGVIFFWGAVFVFLVVRLTRETINKIHGSREQIALAHKHVVLKNKEIEKTQAEKEKLINDLQNALQEVDMLSGLLPICAWCKKIRDDRGYWNQLETYIIKHSKAKFSHGMCPDCAARNVLHSKAPDEAPEPLPPPPTSPPSHPSSETKHGNA